jgi:hypothetical protein
MTQHRWQTEDGYDVLTGWDRPLACYFLGISRDCDGCYGVGLAPSPPAPPDTTCDVCQGRGEEYLYDNLDHGNGRMTLIDVETTLKQYLTDYPPEIVMRLAADRQHNAGNEINDYPPIGRARAEGLNWEQDEVDV